MKPLPSFSDEILRYILTLSGSYEILTSAVLAQLCNLVQLCKKTHEWITPILYNMVVLIKTSQVIAFSHAVKAEKLGSKVRTLIFRLDEPYTALKHVAAAICGCPNLEILFDSGFMSHRRLNRHRSRFPTPWQVAIFTNWGLSGLLPPVGNPLLKSVTHLHINGFEWPEFDELAVPLILSIPTLTHLACTPQYDWKQGSSCIRAILRSTRSLRILLVLKTSTVAGRPTWEELLDIEDERLLARIGAFDTFEQDVTMTSGKSIWDDAEIQCKTWRTLALNKAHRQSTDAVGCAPRSV